MTTDDCLSGKVDDQGCAVKGPMIVMRVRPDGMGKKVVSLLQRYMAYTQSQPQQWQYSGQDAWQLFEVVGDLGKSDQTEVMSKLSVWAKKRSTHFCCRTSSAVHGPARFPCLCLQVVLIF